MSYAQPTTAHRSSEQAPAKRTTALDRAIEAAEAFVPEFLSIFDKDGDAQEHAFAVNAAMAEHKKAAEAYADQAEPKPELLKFKRDPDRRMVAMTFRFASGREVTSDYQDAEFFEPESRSCLAKHCQESGLAPAPYLDAWDQWRTRHQQAFEAAMPQQWRDAEAAEKAAAAAWDAAYGRLRLLTKRLLKARVTTPADVVRKMQAYARIAEQAKFDLDFIEADEKLEWVMGDLRRMPELPGRKPNLRLVA